MTRPRLNGTAKWIAAGVGVIGLVSVGLSAHYGKAGEITRNTESVGRNALRIDKVDDHLEAIDGTLGKILVTLARIEERQKRRGS